ACIVDVATTGDSSFASAAAGVPAALSAGPSLYDLVVDAQSLTADKVSVATVGADGTVDGAFDATVRGPIANLTLVATDAMGGPTGGQVWDTVAGNGIWVLGVEENGSLLSNSDGSVMPIGAGLHQLRLYAQDRGFFRAGQYFRLSATLADGTQVQGPV